MNVAPVAPAANTIIYRYCMVCTAFLGTKCGEGQSGISHGMCEDCYAAIKSEGAFAKALLSARSRGSGLSR